MDNGQRTAIEKKTNKSVSNWQLAVDNGQWTRQESKQIATLSDVHSQLSISASLRGFYDTGELSQEFNDIRVDRCERCRIEVLGFMKQFQQVFRFICFLKRDCHFVIQSGFLSA